MKTTVCKNYKFFFALCGNRSEAMRLAWAWAKSKAKYFSVSRGVERAVSAMHPKHVLNAAAKAGVALWDFLTK